MKLSFVALVVLLSTVAGNHPSHSRRTSHGPLRSNVAKSTIGHISASARGITHLNNHLIPAAKPHHTKRGHAGKKHHDIRTPTPNQAPGKSGVGNSNKNEKERGQNAIQPSHNPKWNPSIGKSGNGKNGTTSQLPRQYKSLPSRSSISNPAAGKSGYSNSVSVGEAQQHTTSQKSLKPPKNKKFHSDKVDKTPQQRKTRNFKPPKTGMSGNSKIAKEGKHQQDKNTPSKNTGEAEKSGFRNSGKGKQTNQKQNAATNTLPSTSKPPAVEKSGNSTSPNVGQSQQQLNVSQHTSTLKPPSAEKSGNSSSFNVEETLQQHNNFSSRTELRHHYHYSPPPQISYGSTIHPVYQGRLPVYVYEYRNSGSRFDNLLTGLALYNLGRNSHDHSNRQYSSSSGEICKLGISKRSGEYEETRIDCNLMSSFILEDTTSAARNEQHVVKNTTVVTVPQTVNGTGNSSVTVTSTSVEDALKVKGPSIEVTPGMTCYMIRTFRDATYLRKSVDCGLLQEYSRNSLFRNSAQCLMPFMTIAFSSLVIFKTLVTC